MSNSTAGHETQWHTSVWPLIISVGILFLGPLAFSFHFVYKNPFLATLSLGIGVPLILLSIAGWTKEGVEDVHHYSEGHGVWAMPVFILAEALLFVGFFAAYWYLRFTAPAWPPPGTPEISHVIPVIMTIILISSSIAIHVAEKRLEEDDHSGYLTWLVVTIALGTLFLCLKGYEWSELFHEGFYPRTNMFFTTFFSLTGFHGSHVLVGIGMFLCALVPALWGKISKSYVTAASIYWHFVDVIWLFVVSQVYFL